MKNKIAFFVFLLFILNSCQSLKDGLTGKKRDNSDEFLVEKKNPLEIPPDFEELPEPKYKEIEDISESIDENVEELIDSISDKGNEITKSNDSSAEEFVLEQLNQN